MTHPGSRVIRLALVAPIAALALFASQTGLRPPIADATVCQLIGAGPSTAVYYNPTFTVTGIVNATGCTFGVYYDITYSGVNPPNINGATIYGASASGVSESQTPKLTIQNSLLRNNGGNGITIQLADALLYNVKMSANGNDGLQIVSPPIAASNTININSSYAINNGNDGISINDVGVTIRGSIISGNKHDGIFAQCLLNSVFCFPAPALVLTGDNVVSNGIQGLDVFLDATVYATSSNFSLNAGNGVFLGGGTNVTLTSSKATSNGVAGAFLVDNTFGEPFLQMNQSSAMYNPIGIDVESSTTGGASLHNYSRACSNSIIDLETKNPANVFVDATSQVCKMRQA
jgi:hypothetical protein